MAENKFDKIFPVAIVICFNAQLIFMPLAFIAFPISYMNDIPQYAPGALMINNIGLSLYMIGATLMAIKLADDKQILSAAGFTALAISAGVVLASTFEIMNMKTTEAWEKSYYISGSSNFIYLPAMLLIACNAEFKKWIRVLGIVSGCVYFISSILFFLGNRDFSELEKISFIGYLLMLFVQLIWSLQVWRQFHPKKSKVSVKG